MQNIYESLAANRRNSFLVVAGFFGFISLAVYFLTMGLSSYYGYTFSGSGYIGIAMVISGLASFFSYYYSDRIILSISGARPADKKQDFTFFTVAENISLAAGVPIPGLYVIKDTAMNAFAAGRDPHHSIICATTGLLANLDRTELEGVIGHEMSHIINYDTRLMSLVTVMVGIVTLLADWLLRATWFSRRDSDNENRGQSAVFMVIGLLFAVVSPLVSQLIQLAISRRREFFADASAVKLTRQPQGLISALTKLSADREPLEAANKATAHLYIVNPLKNLRTDEQVNRFAGLFNTHPPVADRIRALNRMQ